MTHRTPHSKIWTVLCLLIFLALASSGCRPSVTVEEEATPTPYPTPVIPTKPTYAVQRGEVVKSMEFSGRVTPKVQEELYFRTSGRVLRVLVKKGEQVTAGQLLAEVESGASEIDIRRAEIALEMARLNLQRAQINTPPYAKDHDIILAMQQYEVELAQLTLDDLRARIANAQVTAPFDGTIMALGITENTLVEAYKGIVTLADLTQMEVSADLLSEDLQALQEGMSGRVWPVNSPEKILDATIARLPYPYGKPDPDQPVNKDDKASHIELAKPPETIGVELGGLVRVEVILENHKDVLWLPPQAIRTFEGRKFVVVVGNGAQQRVDVKVGITSPDRVEILDGLSEGQVVIAP